MISTPINNYVHLQAAFGSSLEEATAHYVVAGYPEEPTDEVFGS